MRKSYSRTPNRALATVVATTLLAVGAVAAAELQAPSASAAVPTVTCSTDPSILNTGYDGAGGRLASGTDTHWEIGDGANKLSPSSVTTWADATIVSNPNPLWTTSPYNNASWISHSTTGQHTGHHFYYFRYEFVLDPAVKVDAFSVSLDFFADNSVEEIWVNGEAQSDVLPEIPQALVDPEWYYGFIASNAASTTLDHDWRTGQNEIIVLVETEAPNVGFLAQTTSAGYCADYGDAPASYGTAKDDGGPAHTLGSTNSPLTLGSRVDVEGEPEGFDGLGDDTEGVDDEDGVGHFPTITTLSSDYSVPVAVRNTTGAVATLAGWIDFDRDGTFGDAERSVAEVAPGATTATLTWAGISSQGDTYARFRIFAGTVTDPQPTGEVTGGEVEDYPFSIDPAQLHITKTADKSVVEEGADLTYTITVTNDGPVVAQRVRVEDDLSDVLADALYVTGGADRGIYDFSGQLVTWTGDLRAGETATITVTVQVHATPAGDRNLINTVVDASRDGAPTSNCEYGSSQSDCVAPVIAGPAFDFGDAPASYGTARSTSGAIHALRGYSADDNTAVLMIGDLVDSEPDARAADEQSGAADEDGIELPPITDATTDYRVTAEVVNTTSAPATIAGWVDFDDSGSFDANERATAVVAPGALSVELVWADVDVDEGSTETRFRLFSGAVANPQPTGLSVGGEVEDYGLVVGAAPTGLFGVNGTLASTGSTIATAIPFAGLTLLIAGLAMFLLARARRQRS
ncbi:hypothetical protein BH10ACT7_BH10ACT7_05400 [soil metagenome]